MVKLHGQLKQFRNVNKILSQKDNRNNSILHFSLKVSRPQFQMGTCRHQIRKTLKLSWNCQAISIITSLRMSVFLIFCFSAVKNHHYTSFCNYSYPFPSLRAMCAPAICSITPHCCSAATSRAIWSLLTLINGGTSFLAQFQKLRPENFQDAFLILKFVCKWDFPSASSICMGT